MQDQKFKTRSWVPRVPAGFELLVLPSLNYEYVTAVPFALTISIEPPCPTVS